MYDIWDVFQHGQIADVESKVSLANQHVDQLSGKIRTEIQRLEAKIDGLALIAQAQWELLQERTDLSEDDIKNKMDEIDQRDGVRDGRITGKPIDCPGCGRRTHTRIGTCMYCATKLE